MNRYEIDQLVKLWGQEQLTVEQAIGQLLLYVKVLVEQVGKLEQSQRTQHRSGPSPAVQGGGG